MSKSGHNLIQLEIPDTTSTRKNIFFNFIAFNFGVGAKKRISYIRDFFLIFSCPEANFGAYIKGSVLHYPMADLQIIMLLFNNPSFLIES